MRARIPLLLGLGLILSTPAAAEVCRLDHALYRENQSGAELEFRAKDGSVDDTLTTALFRLRLPNLTAVFEGNVTWNAGANARPDGSIARDCGIEDDSEGRCWLWTGNIFGLKANGAFLLDSADMPAPAGLLLNDFGRALATTQVFADANPERPAFDVFGISGCRP